MPNQNDSTQNPNPVNPPVAEPTGITPPPVISPQSDLPPLPPAFQNLNTEEKPAATEITPPPLDTGSAAPPDISSVIPKPKKTFGGGKIIATILGLFLLVGGVGAGIILTQQPQLLQQKAAVVTTSYCPFTDCDIGSTVPGAVQCMQNNGSLTYCCPTGSPLYNSDTKTCGGGNSCAPSTSVNTYGKGYTGTVPAGTYGCTNSVQFNCKPNEEADLGRSGDCSCYSECSAIQTDCSKEVSGNCSKSIGSCYVTTNIGTALDGCPCIGAHYTTCATGYICSNNNCLPATPTSPPTSPPNTPTSPPSGPYCSAVQAYDANYDLPALTSAQLSALTPGTVVNFCVSGGGPSGTTFDQAKFTINGTTLTPTTTHRTGSTDFCQSYIILPTDTTVNVSAQIHSGSNWY